MLSFMQFGGPFMWLLLLFSAAILYLVIKKGIELFFKKNVAVEKLEAGLDGILFWGILSAVCGFLSQFTGIYLALVEIIKADDVSPQIIIDGYASSFVAVIFGFWVLLISSVIWYFYKARLRKIKNS